MVNDVINNAVIVGTIEMILSGQDANLVINSSNINDVLKVMELLRLIDVIKVSEGMVMLNNDVKAIIANLLNNSLNTPY